VGEKICAITTGRPVHLDLHEPERVAEAAATNLGLPHVVVISVARDELCDRAASRLSPTIHAIREKISAVVVEVLIPDFKGSEDSLRIVLEERSDILNHNLGLRQNSVDRGRVARHLLRLCGPWGRPLKSMREKYDVLGTAVG
jgi:lipoic acid synthetase